MATYGHEGGYAFNEYQRGGHEGRRNTVAAKPKTARAWFVCLNGKPLVKVGGYPRDEAKFICASKEATARRLSSYAPAKYTVQQFTLTPVKKARKRNAT